MLDIKRCESGSVGRRGGLLWWSDATADGDACSSSSSCGTADAAAAVLSDGHQVSRALRDSSAVCEGPTRGTGHVDLQEDNSDVEIRCEGNFGDTFVNLYLLFLYQLMCFPTGGTPEMEHGSTRHVMSPQVSQGNASDLHDVDGIQTRSQQWTEKYSLERE